MALFSGRTADTRRPNPSINSYLDPSSLTPVAVFPLWEMDGQSPRDMVAVGGTPSSIGLRQLTIGGSPGLSLNGQFGEAPDLDGTNDYFYISSPTSDLQITGALTICCWVAISDAPGTHNLVSLAGDADATEAKNTLYQLSVVASQPKILWETGSGSDISHTCDTAVIDTEGHWYFLAVTRATDGVVNWYVGDDDTAVYLVDTSGTLTMPTGGGTSAFAVGAYARDYSNKLQGAINGVWIDNSELSLANIETLYNASVRSACSVVA